MNLFRQGPVLELSSHTLTNKHTLAYKHISTLGSGCRFPEYRCPRIRDDNVIIYNNDNLLLLCRRVYLYYTCDSFSLVTVRLHEIRRGRVIMWRYRMFCVLLPRVSLPSTMKVSRNNTLTTSGHFSHLCVNL